ncbi:hypothetical protein KZI27_00390 (plasmid) [Curtobacterium sp. TC1]|nr:hypothetical protein KZI27_00390 [Curtobacterium sp. TC1]
MAFQGEVLSVSELMRRSDAQSHVVPTDAGVRHTAAANAARITDLLRAGEPAAAAWRFGILQTLDDYRSTLRRGGATAAAGVFADEPALTGSQELDAAFAALADHLAATDGWTPPEWAAQPARSLPGAWFATTPDLFRDEAVSDSPPAFRKRGIFITRYALSRA